MNTPPFISIITPTLNRASFIERTIHSVLDQHYPYFEHIIVDGLSTDNTTSILSKYKHLKTYSFKCSATEAQNFAIEHAKGDLICFIGSDDYLLPEVFSTVAEVFSDSRNKDIDLFSGSFIVMKKNKIIYKASRYHNVLDIGTLVYGAPGMSSSFFKGDIFKRLGFLRHDLTIANDRGLIAELVLGKVKSIMIPKHFMVYSYHDASISLNTKSKFNKTIIKEHLLLSKELITRTKKGKLKRYFQAWHAFEKFKEIILDFKEKKYIIALNHLQKFLMSSMFFIFLFYSLRFYVRWKTLFKLRVIRTIYLNSFRKEGDKNHLGSS